MNKFLSFLTFLGASIVATPAFAAYTSLITSADFDGPKADVNTVILNIIMIFVAIFAAGLIIRHLRG